MRLPLWLNPYQLPLRKGLLSVHAYCITLMGCFPIAIFARGMMRPQESPEMYAFSIGQILLVPCAIWIIGRLVAFGSMYWAKKEGLANVAEVREAVKERCIASGCFAVCWTFLSYWNVGENTLDWRSAIAPTLFVVVASVVVGCLSLNHIMRNVVRLQGDAVVS